MAGETYPVRQESVETDSFFAAAALTSNRNYFVKKTAEKTINKITAIGDLPFGVQTEQDLISIGKQCSVKFVGEYDVRVSETIALDADIGVSANGSAQNCVAGQYHVGKCTRAAGSAGDLCKMEIFRIPRPNYSIPLVASGAAVLIARDGGSITEGWTRYMIDEDVVIPSAVANVDLTTAVPTGAIVKSVQANNETTITATTATKVGIGPAGDPNKYGLSADLVKNTKYGGMGTLATLDYVVLAGAETNGIYAVDAAGAAAGTIDTGTVRVRIVYETLDDLDDAA